MYVHVNKINDVARKWVIPFRNEVKICTWCKVVYVVHVCVDFIFMYKRCESWPNRRLVTRCEGKEECRILRSAGSDALEFACLAVERMGIFRTI